VKLAFWISLAGILYTYVGYSWIVWIRARLWPQRWNVAPISPSISIVLAVHNGAALLSRKIDHLLSLDYSNLQEIIIVSDGSTDGTAEKLAECHLARVVPVVLKEHVGKAVALNAGMKKAHAEVILFVDIRPEIAPGAIQHLVSNFADPTVGCVTGELILRHANHDDTTAAVGGLYWRYEQWIRKCEAMCDSTVGVYGGFYAIRRELATEQPAGIILDDMFQPLSIVRGGYRSVLDTAAHVYDTWPQDIEDEFNRKVRTLAGNFQLLQRAPWTLTLQNRVLVQFFSHKLLRLVAPYLLIVLAVCTLALSSESAVYAVFAVVQSVCLGIAITGLRFRLPVLHYLAAPASGLFMLNAAAVVGLHRFLFTRGPLWKIWNTSNTATKVSTNEPVDSMVPGPVVVTAAMEIATTLQNNSNRQQRGPLL
jgi:cellulose synthase/poly-beta-1,6-N-acetylglucosamine synthase-like glycosyltransferase